MAISLSVKSVPTLISQGVPGQKLLKHCTFSTYAGLQKHQTANLCSHAIYPQGYGTHVYGSGTRTLRPDIRSLLAV